MNTASFLAAVLVLFAASALQAEIKTEVVEYADGDAALQGEMVYDNLLTPGTYPGIVIAHQWMGITDHERHVAQELAKSGYVAFIADIYGKGVHPTNMKEAGAQAGKFKGDRALLRRRINLALEQVKKNPFVDPARLGAIGFCFGGTAVLELARSGANVKAIVSFHGGLATPTPEDAKNIKAKVLVCHGAVDPNVKPEEVAGFVKEMEAAKVDYQLIEYSQAVHSFTQKEAGNDPSKGAAYNENAAKRSWQHMKLFFEETLAIK
jgi:dienelactone hydrolase